MNKNITLWELDSVTGSSKSMYKKNRKTKGDEEEGSPMIYTDNPCKLKYEMIEPITHTNNNNNALFNRIIFRCIYHHKHRLTLPEIRCFNKVRIEANTKFLVDYDYHNNLLKELWFLINGKCLNEIKNIGWKDIGFQNIDPRTDFRSGGILALYNLVYFAKNFKSKILEMNEEKNDFLFAITSINITYFLVRYYHLADYLDHKRDFKDLATRKALKNFVAMLVNDENLFNKIHSMLLKDVFDIWLECKRRWTDITIMEFQVPMNSLKEKYTTVTKSGNFQDFEEMHTIYNIQPNHIVRVDIKIPK